MTHTITARPAPEAQIQQTHCAPPLPPSGFHAEYLQLIERLRPIRERAERLRWSVFARAAAACQQAGLDPAWAGTQLHNCLIDFGHGRPWQNIDPVRAQQSQDLYQQQFRALRVFDRYFARLLLELTQRWSGDAAPLQAQ